MYIKKCFILIVCLLSAQQTLVGYDAIRNASSAFRSYIHNSSNVVIGTGVLGSVMVGAYCVHVYRDYANKIAKSNQDMYNKVALENIENIKHVYNQYAEPLLDLIEQLRMGEPRLKAFEALLRIAYTAHQNNVFCHNIYMARYDIGQAKNQFLVSQTSTSTSVAVNIAGVYHTVTCWTPELQKEYDKICELYDNMGILIQICNWAPIIDMVSFDENNIQASVVAAAREMYAGKTSYPLVNCVADVCDVHLYKNNKLYEAFTYIIEHCINILVSTPEYVQEVQAYELHKQQQRLADAAKEQACQVKALADAKNREVCALEERNRIERQK